MILGSRACGVGSVVEASDPAADRGPSDMSACRPLLPFVAALVAAFVALGGCTSRSATFPGHSDREVWQAMVTAAEEPVYDDWFVFDNQVMVDRDQARIEIYRILRRDLVRPGSPPQRQEEDWRFVVHATQSDPPTVQFTTRQAAVPAHVWREAERYFYDVRTLLNGGDPSADTAVEVIEPAASSNATFEDLMDANRP
jgi:hypothetical protein